MKNKLKLFLGLAIIMTGVTSAQVGINTTSPQGALDITSTTSGLLVPRMTSAQRDAITSPANALLIFNISNNSFEVFKGSCSCWVTMTDGGNTPASSVVNTAPTANNVFISGQCIVGKTVTINYTYTDGQLDSEGLTTIQWQISSESNGTNPINIANAINTTYTPISNNVGNYIRAVINPRATSGVLNGVSTYSPWVLVEASITPTANNLIISGTPAQGNTLTASYTFTGGSGIEDVTPTGTIYTWQSASNLQGQNVANASLYNQSAYTSTYVPQSDLLGRFIRVAAKAKDSNGLQATNFVNSPWIGPVVAATESAPVVTNVTYNPAPGKNFVHTLNYSYFDSNYDPEGASIYQWYNANNALGTGATAITGANSSTYTGMDADVGTYLGVGVTPKALSGTITGTEVRYFNSNPTISSADFTFTASNPKQFPFYYSNRTMDVQNGIQIEINVTTAGALRFTSPVINGYQFSSNIIVSTGTQWITLIPLGVQTGYNASGDNIVLTGIGETTQNKSFTIYNTKVGGDYNSYFNGVINDINTSPALSLYTTGQTFSANNTCAGSAISAGYTSGTCTGSVTIGSNSYPLVLINGQCWMQTNLKEVPSNFSSYTTSSMVAATGVTFSDMGYWGYYNTTTPAGTAGWQANEPATGVGFLYQWSAAMNGSTLERSQGVCPSGFHIPSDCEWMYLEHGQGMVLSQQTVNSSSNNRVSGSAVTGNRLRSTTAGGGTNVSGFTGLFTGLRDGTGLFSLYSTTPRSYFWTSTVSTSSTSFSRTLRTGDAGVNRFNATTSSAYAVRCIKD